MPISFARLRIAGFKSFAEPAIVEILPGLTGIVGPNGCGKSNVAEALRWGMGESSARSMRGGEMDDVIFSGTTARPSRNLAEVTLTLEDAAGAAPPPFHEQVELQISRRIERGAGSAFRINGREARARDVQTLFADLASGARSAAMVSQGRVGAIVNARPDERRAVLEEAAGITGLHSRRHEAELKLRAAETNLARAEELQSQLETQLAGLKRQARQATRYRMISGAVREAEGELLALRRARAEAERTQAAAALHAAQNAAVATATTATAAAAAATEAAANVPPLRSIEAESRTLLERARVAREGFAAEAARAQEALAASEQRLRQITRDLSHAEQSHQDAAAARARLDAEAAQLAQAAGTHPAIAEQARAAAQRAADAAQDAESLANEATEHAAELTARNQALGQMLAQAEARSCRVAEQVTRLQQDRTHAVSQGVDTQQVAAAAAELARAATTLSEISAALDAAEISRAETAAAAATAREQLHRAEAIRTKLAAETGALSEMLAVKDGEKWPPMVDALEVPPGLEAALGAALGEELAAARNPDAARHWREMEPLAPAKLPGAALSELVRGPAALARALSSVGLVETEADGDAAQPGLTAGQALVSRSGAVWRWDGYTIRAGTPTAAAVRLQQRNRLAVLRARLIDAEQDAAEARRARDATGAAETAATHAEQQARTGRRDAEQRLDRARSHESSLRGQAEAADAKLAGLDEQIARLSPERADADAALDAAHAQRAAPADASAARAELDRARRVLAAARGTEQAALRTAETLVREAASRDARSRTISAECGEWRKRAEDAAGRVVDLAARKLEAAAEHDRLTAAPDTIAHETRQSIDALEAAEAAHRRAADALSAASGWAAQADRAVRAAEQALSGTREAVVRAEAAMGQAAQAWGIVAERILERLGAAPALPDPPADPSPEAEEKARKRLERLQREREEMGPVNLRAEIEAAEIETAISAIARERDELGSAIAKLRGSIGHLNREGRDRLAAVFQQVDRNFQALFARMFNGGRAHLAMVGSDDPLQAGLEIYAQPPGKKLATLSLLSGGEQALTALSLIFAMFRCNPAPVCVLDEVDAPLDDANVERFCALLDDMVGETGTRFLVVTHHYLTMARMDRLYGVTMQERGVSRLLSVDLERAAAMVEARVAAE